MANKEKEERYFSIDWKIENISYCSEKNNESITSPSFVVDEMGGTSWFIRIYPRGHGSRSGDYINFGLYRKKDDNPAIAINVKFDIAIICEIGFTFRSKTCMHCFEKGEELVLPLSMRRKYIFVEKRSIFLPQDTLTVRFRMWKNCEPMLRDIRYFARTRIGLEKRSFLWNLENFSTLELEKKCSYLIKSHKNNAPIMSIDLFVTGGVNCDEIVRFELSIQDKTIKYSTLRLFFVNSCGNRVRCNQEEFWFDEQSVCEKYRFTFDFTRKQLLDEKTLVLPHDVLSLQWEWVFPRGIVLEEIEEVQYGCTSSKEIEEVQYGCTSSEAKISHDYNVNNHAILPSNCRTLNMLCFLARKFLCDVILKTSTNTFMVHKIILCASSLFFRRLFSTCKEDKTFPSIPMEDLDDDTLFRIICYMYTSQIKDLTWTTAARLYKAADTYYIPSLKNICSTYLIQELNDTNVWETGRLFENHADRESIIAVSRYIFARGLEIIALERNLILRYKTDRAGYIMSYVFSGF